MCMGQKKKRKQKEVQKKERIKKVKGKKSFPFLFSFHFNWVKLYIMCVQLYYCYSKYVLLCVRVTCVCTCQQWLPAANKNVGT